MSPYRLVIADDHTLCRQGFKKILESDPGLKVVGEAADGFELQMILEQANPDMTILEVSMPYLSPTQAIPGMKRRFPHMKVVVLSNHKEYLHQSLCGGAEGFLLKKDTERDLFLAIGNIRLGRTYVSPRIAAELVEARACPSTSLSNREKDVLKLIAQGKSNKESASILFISVRTVESHRARIMSKLRLSSSADIVRYAMQKGLI